MARSNPLSQPYPGGASKGSKWTTDTGYGLQVNQIFTAVLGVSGSLAAWQPGDERSPFKVDWGMSHLAQPLVLFQKISFNPLDAKKAISTLISPGFPCIVWLLA